MKHGKKLTRKMIIALDKLGMKPSDYLYTKRDYDSFTPYNIKTGLEESPVRY